MRRRQNTSLENQVQVVFFSTLNCPLSTWVVQHRIILFHSFNIPILKLNFPISTWLFQIWVVLFQHDYFKAELSSFNMIISLYCPFYMTISKLECPLYMIISKLNCPLSTWLFQHWSVLFQHDYFNAELSYFNIELSSFIWLFQS